MKFVKVKDFMRSYTDEIDLYRRVNYQAETGEEIVILISYPDKSVEYKATVPKSFLKLEVYSRKGEVNYSLENLGFVPISNIKDMDNLISDMAKFREIAWIIECMEKESPWKKITGDWTKEVMKEEPSYVREILDSSMCD